jgi:hypothetical protein
MSSSTFTQDTGSVVLPEEGKSDQTLAPPRRSMLKSIGLIATCAGAMIVNVSPPSLASSFLLTLASDL